MKLEELLLENFEEILSEAKKKKLVFNPKSKKSLKQFGFIPMVKTAKGRNGERIDPRTRAPELTTLGKKNVTGTTDSGKYHKYPEYKDDGYKKFKPGRERLITSVISRCSARGVSISSVQARDYIYDFYNRWLSGGESWLDKYEAKAKAAGFNVRKYLEQARGASSGVWRKEWKGRAQFFIPFMNAVANHFLPKNKWWGEYETLSKPNSYDEYRKHPYKWWGSKSSKEKKESSKNKS